MDFQAKPALGSRAGTDLAGRVGLLRGRALAEVTGKQPEDLFPNLRRNALLMPTP